MSAEPHYVQADYRERVKPKKRSKRLVNQREAYLRGRRDFHKRGRGDCPFRDAAMAEAWERGYDAELKRSYGRSAGLL